MPAEFARLQSSRNNPDSGVFFCRDRAAEVSDRTGFDYRTGIVRAPFVLKKTEKSRRHLDNVMNSCYNFGSVRA